MDCISNKLSLLIWKLLVFLFVLGNYPWKEILGVVELTFLRQPISQGWVNPALINVVTLALTLKLVLKRLNCFYTGILFPCSPHQTQTPWGQRWCCFLFLDPVLGTLRSMYEIFSKHLNDSVNSTGVVSVHYLDWGKMMLLYVIDKDGHCEGGRY